MGFEDRFITEKQVLAINCKRIRKRKNKLQTDISVSTNLRATRLSAIENAKSNVEFATLHKLKSGLQTNINFLFEDPTSPLDEITFTPTELDVEKMNFSNRLLQLMLHLNVTQRDLSIMISMGEGEISSLVNGHHNVELITIVKIALALKTTIPIMFMYNSYLPNKKGYKQELIY